MHKKIFFWILLIGTLIVQKAIEAGSLDKSQVAVGWLNCCSGTCRIIITSKSSVPRQEINSLVKQTIEGGGRLGRYERALVV